MKQRAGEIKRRNIPFRLEEEAFLALVSRVTDGKYRDRVRIRQSESESGFDEYRCKAEENVLTIFATSGVAGAVAFNQYLQKYCGYYYGILTRSGTLPDRLPDTKGEICEKSVFHYRYAFNYCTFGYSYAFNDWRDWERVTDYLILSGYNLVLNPIGNECVWVKLLQEYGYSLSEALSYISAPNYLPWQWMMNLSAFESCISPEWLNEQQDIARKFNAKLKAFGMSAVMPGYCGAVPDDFDKGQKDVKVILQGKWAGFCRPSILSHENKLFASFAVRYYQLQRELLDSGEMHYYSADPFHEGGEKSGIDLKEYARSVYAAMRAADEKAVWVFQGWQSNPDRTLLSALPKEDVLILNLHGDCEPDGGDDFLGYPHIYCVVNNFGGEYAMRGSAVRTYLVPHSMAKSEESSCVGIGSMPEGVECDEILFDIISEVSVKENLAPVHEFLSEYAYARYGVAHSDLTEAQEIAFEKVYTEDSVCYCHESGLMAYPTPEVNRVCYWAGAAAEEDNSHLARMASLLLNHWEECKTRESYCTDVVAICRQLTANESWKHIYALNRARKSGEEESFRRHAAALLNMFSLQEALVDCDEKLSLRNYLEKARRRGKNEREKIAFERNAKRLITLWSKSVEGATLHDYSPREYGDMLRLFYKPRWVVYVENAIREMRGEPVKPYDRYAVETEFIERKTPVGGKKIGDLYRAARNILDAYESGTL